jgi:hypothetical protein
MSDVIETDDDTDEIECEHDWQENCGPETNHRANCRCGYFCTECGANSRD